MENEVTLCIKCHDPLPEFDYVLCNFCKGKLHYECAGVRESNWRKIRNDVKKNWKCYTCRQHADIIFPDRGGDVPENKHAEMDKHLQQQQQQHEIQTENTALKVHYENFMKSPIFESLKLIVKQLTKEEISKIILKITEMEMILEKFGDKQQEFSIFTTKISNDYLKLKKEYEILQQSVLEKERKCECLLEKDRKKSGIASATPRKSPGRRESLDSKRLSLIPVRPKKSFESTTSSHYRSMDKELNNYSTINTSPFDYGAFGEYVGKEMKSLQNENNKKKLRFDILRLCLEYHEKEEENERNVICKELQ